MEGEREVLDLAKRVSLDECQQWWNDAVVEMRKSLGFADAGFDEYDPRAERILRLINEVTRLRGECAELLVKDVRAMVRHGAPPAKKGE